MADSTHPETHHGSNPRHGMSLIVKTVTRWLAGFILLFGIHVVLYGHETPGGGFAGGIAIASAFILLTLAFGLPTAIRDLGQRQTTILASAGVLIFLGLAVAGLFFANVFFKNFIGPANDNQHGLFSAVFILLCEIGVALVVAMSIFHVFCALSKMRVTKKH